MILLVFLLIVFILLSKIKKESLKSIIFLIKITIIFFALIITFNESIEIFIINKIIFILQEINFLFPFIRIHSEAKMISIINSTTAVSFFLDYECTGVIEILVFISLILTYPINNKIILSILGTLYLFFANIIRILLIASIVYYFGRDSLFIAHSVVARLVYFAITVTLYYKVFTERHIKEQKVGDL